MVLTITVSTLLPCRAERVWQEIIQPRLLLYIIHPLLKLEPVDPPQWPQVWGERAYVVKLKPFGFIPFGRHAIVVTKEEFPEQGEYHARDNGYGINTSIRKWDHTIMIRAIGENEARYTDHVTIDAGIWTPFIWLYAWLFYTYRQWRWRTLIKNNFHY